MKAFAISILLTIGLGLGAQAETKPVQKNSIKASKAALSNESTGSLTTTFKPSEIKSKSFRVGISKPQYAAGIEIGIATGGTVFSDTEDPDVDYANGLKFGYSYLPVKNLGFIADFDYIEINLDEKSNNIARLSGNAAVAIGMQASALKWELVINLIDFLDLS
jgi:hypothetical protein